MTALDIATARARHAAWLGAVRPRLLRPPEADDCGCVRVRSMRHPLLLQRALPPLPEPPAAAEADFGASHLSMLGLPPPPPPAELASAAANGAGPVARAITTALALDSSHLCAVTYGSYCCSGCKANFLLLVLNELAITDKSQPFWTSKLVLLGMKPEELLHAMQQTVCDVMRCRQRQQSRRARWTCSCGRARAW